MIRTFSQAAAGAVALALSLPGVAAAHALVERYEAPLPLVAYIGGAALAVAMSFAFVMLRGERRPQPAAAARPRVRTVPRWLRGLLSAVGLLAWLWIMLQGFFGGSDPTADVGNVFAWVLGWVGVAVVSALIAPIWTWLDPFSTIHRLLSALSQRVGLTSGSAAARPWPLRLGKWPAVLAILVVIWLELVAFVLGGRLLATVILAYTLFTLAGMSYFGRDAWRQNAEVFSVWFGLLNRLAPFGAVGAPEEGRLERRPFASALTAARWTSAEIVLVTLGTAAIIYDGISQTDIYVRLFYQTDWPLPPLLLHTLVMGAFFAFLLALVFGVVRQLGRQAVGAGLLPVAVGYLLAHYIVALLIDSQALILALNDPLLRGDDLLPYPFSQWQPALFIPVSLLWSLQLAAVVGGHVIGAWAGHATLSGSDASQPLRQLPLAALMVFLTSLTLWSLGQEVVAPEGSRAPVRDQIATTAPGPDQRAVSSAASTALMICSLRAASSRKVAQPAETETGNFAPRSSVSAISRS